MTRIPRPGPGDCAEYFLKYVELVPEGDLLAHLEAQPAELAALAGQFGEARGGHRYAPGKWSVKEIIGHLTDTERIQATRVLRIARGDAALQPSFDMDGFVAAAGADRRSLADLLAEFRAVRSASLALLASLDPEALARRGSLNGREMTAAAVAHVMAGHISHHAATLRAKYLP